MILSATRQALSETLALSRENGRSVGLVPTMGFLHQGHLSLVDLARESSDFLAVSIFVNPLQFGPGEDLERYPRDLERDLALLRGRGVDLVFCPSVQEMYPDGEVQVTVDPGSMADGLCGAYRPDHFRGVLTVVARLFGLFRPNVAVLGQKDYQQWALVRRMVLDLEMGVEVLLGPTVRERDGLALSSRNVFLSGKERSDAVGLNRALRRVEAAFLGGESSGTALRGILAEEVGKYPLLKLQYGEIVHPKSLEPLEEVMPGAVAAVAAHCGSTRLIDNHVLKG